MNNTPSPQIQGLEFWATSPEKRAVIQSQPAWHDENIWRNNLDALARHRPELHKVVSEHQWQSVGDVLPTASGFPTIRFFREGGDDVLAYGLDDPWQEAACHLDTIGPEANGLALFVGFGLGYGVLQVLSQRPLLSTLAVFEPNFDLFYTALRVVDLVPLIIEDKVYFFIGDINLTGLEHNPVGRCATLYDTHILRYLPSYQWDHGYKALDTDLFMVLNTCNAQGGTTRLRGQQFFKNRLENLAMAHHWQDLGALRGRFRNKPAVLVAAGPSLDSSLPTLQKIKDRCVIISVDSALAPLLAAGISPDFVTTIDCQGVNLEKLTPFLGTKHPFSLVAMVKSTPLIAKRLHPKHMFLAFPEDRPHMWMLKTLKMKTIVPPAFSVAHLNLGVALILEADPIIFVGQDLAYTANDNDHAAGTILVEGIKNGKPTGDMEVYYETGLDGTRLATNRGLLSLKKLFEEIIKYHPRTYLNATAAGLHIRGTEAMALQEVAEKYVTSELPVARMVGNALRKGGNLPAPALIGEGRRILRVVRENLQKLAKVNALIGKALELMQRLKRQGATLRGLHDLPSSMAHDLKRIDDFNNSLDKVGVLEHLLEITFKAFTEADDWTERNKALLQRQGYAAWLHAELERMAELNHARDEAYSTYEKLLGDLVERLDLEGQLIARCSEGNEPESLKALAALYGASGDLWLADNMLSKLAKQYSIDDPDVLILQGQIRAGFLDYDGADVYWERATARDPECAQRIKELRFREAELWIDFIEVKGELYPYLLKIWLQRIARLIKPGEELPDSLQTIWKRTASHAIEDIASSRIDVALGLLEPWEDMAQHILQYSYLKARCFHAKGALVEALTELDKAMAHGAEQADWLALAAKVLLEAGDFDQGVAFLQKAVAADCQHAVIWEELGDLLVSQKDFTNALAAYEHCFLALPERTETLLKFGDCYLRDGQLEAAKAAYDSVLAREPANQDVVRRLSMLAQGK